MTTTTLDVEQLLSESFVLSDSHAENTRTSYDRDWKDFTCWCDDAGRDPLPASIETTIAYLTDLMHRCKISTAARRAAGIQYQHQLAGLAGPGCDRIRRLLRGAQRIRCERPEQKRPISVAQLALMCTAAGNSFPHCHIRNRSILTLGFASALRRSNLVALDLADVEFVAEGLLVHVRKEKQDQKALGRRVGITAGTHEVTCPVRALRAWLDVRGDAPGPLYVPVILNAVGSRRLHPSAIGEVVKGAARNISLDPAAYAGHSMRSGMITEAFLRGIDSVVVARHTGHRSLTSLQRYFRNPDPFRTNPSALIGL